MVRGADARAPVEVEMRAEGRQRWIVFDDRRHAGRLLADALLPLRREDPVVLGLPRGGVPVADEVASALDAPLDVIIVRKLGVPFQPELGMGAIGEAGARVLNPQIVRITGVSERDIEVVEERERDIVRRRAEQYRRGRPPLPIEGRVVVVVDDGIATGGTARAAVAVARARGARRVVVAAPVAAQDTADMLRQVADQAVLLETPPGFGAVGEWYRNFGQTSDDEVVRVLDAAESRTAARLGADRAGKANESDRQDDDRQDDDRQDNSER